MTSLTRRRFIGGAAALATGAAFGTALADEPEFVLKVATVAPPGTPWAKHLRKLKKSIREKSDGRLEPKVHLGGGLGGEKSTAGGTGRGDPGVWVGSPSGLAEGMPEINAWELPFLFADERRARQATDAAKGKLVEMLHDKGLELMFVGEFGFHALGTAGPVSGPADLDGLRIATPPGSPRGRVWQALGARAQTLTSKDTADALAGGRADAFSAPPLFALAAGWARAGMHLTLLPMIYSPLIAVVARSTLARLPAADRAVLTADAAERARDLRAEVDRANRELEAKARAAGVTLTRADARTRAAFAARAASVTEAFRRSTSADGRALLDILQGR